MRTENKIQVSVRLPAAVVRYMDDAIADGDAGTRAEWLEHAAELARRTREAEREAAIVQAVIDRGETLYPDLDGLTTWAAANPVSID